MKETWNVSGLILEGISGTGKTTILNKLLNSEQFLNKSFLSSIVLSEHQTQRVLERKEREEGLSVFDSIGLLDQHIKCIEGLNNNLNQMQWCRANQTYMRIPYIFERFHFSHVYQYIHMKWADVDPIDSRLADINCRICILTADFETLKSRLLSGRDEAWMRYIKRFGETEDQIINHFLQQQNQVLELAKMTKLETLTLDTSKTTIDDCIESIFNFYTI